MTAPPRAPFFLHCRFRFQVHHETQPQRGAVHECPDPIVSSAMTHLSGTAQGCSRGQPDGHASPRRPGSSRHRATPPRAPPPSWSNPRSAADQMRARFITSTSRTDALDDDGDNRPGRGKLKSRTRGEVGNPMKPGAVPSATTPTATSSSTSPRRDGRTERHRRQQRDRHRGCAQAGLALLLCSVDDIGIFSVIERNFRPMKLRMSWLDAGRPRTARCVRVASPSTLRPPVPRGQSVCSHAPWPTRRPCHDR